MMSMRKIFLSIGIIALALIAIRGLMPVKSKKAVQGPMMIKYKNFETKNPALDFTFEYPETGWKPGETAGRIEKYDQLYLRGPVDGKTKFTMLIHITVRPLDDGKTASDLLQDYLKMDSNLSKFKTAPTESMIVGGEKAFSALCQYEAIPSERFDVPSVPFRKRMVFVVKGDRSYEFTVNAFASRFDDCTPVLEHILKTFKFKD